MAITSIVHLVGAAVGLATLAKLLTASLLRDLITQTLGHFSLGITPSFRRGHASFTLYLEPLNLLLNHDLLDIL
jgi:hypothetical protein